MNFDEMRHELALYLSWYNRYRPHEYLGARTPQEVYANSPPVKTLESRKGSDIPEMRLELSFLEGREHLPVIEFRKVA